MRRTLPTFLLTLLLAISLGSSPPLQAQNDPTRVNPAGQQPPLDGRIKPAPRHTRDKFHPWTPPTSLEAWKKTSQALREQVLVSNGLWPMPQPAPLQPVIHGKIEKDDYTIEKVFFASHPGHYVSGNLYRPKNLQGKAPGVLCPHGHWLNGRFYEAKEDEARQQIASGAEKFECGAKYPLQARMVGLARMGCVVFHYDMVGNADSTQIGHTAGFKDVEAELRLQNFMGLQTFNSRCALDFLLSLPDVDPNRIGVTGSSGGGTQTFMLCAIDERPHVAFPAVMVSTNMQGGCICENCSYLRQDINNVALAALFAPRPQAMSGADDWTIDIETKGLPELKTVYGFYNAADKVHAKCFPQFGHNYNQVAREMMYSWFNQHLNLGLPEPILEREFIPVPPQELSVYDDAHPLPSDGVDSAGLRDALTTSWTDQYSRLIARSSSEVDNYKQLVGTAARVMLGETSESGEITSREISNEMIEGNVRLVKINLQRATTQQQIPAIALVSDNFNGTVVLWVDGKGKAQLFDKEAKLIPAAKDILKTGRGILAPDLFQTGEFLVDGQPAAPVVEDFAGYTFCLNRPWISERVRDIRLLLDRMAARDYITRIELVGLNGAGPWVALAAGGPHDKLRHVYADLQGFHFGGVTSNTDPNLLPGGLKYGGIGGLAALAAPTPLTIWGTDGIPESELAPLTAMYQAANATLQTHPGVSTPEAVAASIIEK